MKVLPTLAIAATAVISSISTAQAAVPKESESDNNNNQVIGDARPITGDGRGGSWTEIVVSLRTTKQSGPDDHLRGRLDTYDKNGGDERLVDRRNVDLTLDHDSVHVPVPASRGYHVRFVADSSHNTPDWHASVNPETTGYGSLLFDYRSGSGSSSDDGVLRAAAAGVFTKRQDVTVVSLQAMPQSAWTYDRTALFLVDANLLGNHVGEPACAALFDWMKSGGTLVVVDPNANNNKNENAPTLRCGREPLTAQTTPVGRLVVVDKVESNSPTLTSLLNTAVEKHSDRPLVHDLVFLDRVDSAPRVALAGILVLLFGAFVGPGLVLYRRRKKSSSASALRVFPILGATSLATLGAMLLLGRAFAPSRHTTSTVVRDLTSGSADGRVVQTRIFHNPTSPVRVTRAMPGSLLGEEEEYGGMFSVARGRGAFRLESDGTTIVLNERHPSADDYVYLVEAATDHLEGGKPITISCTKDSCTIDNASSVALEQSRLYSATFGFVDVGSIDASSKRTVALPVQQPQENHINHFQGDRPEDRLALRRSARQVSLTARQSRAAQPTIVNVTCLAGCEEATR